MKNKLSVLVILLLSLAPLACNKPFQIPSSPSSGPSAPTPTPNLTPVCGFTTYSLGTISLQAAPGVIRNLTDWQNFYSHGTGTISLTPVTTPVVPAPPVNFANQMLIIIITPVCPSATITVTSVCEGPSQITISANNNMVCYNCNVAANWGYASAIAVPQSNLPIVWNITQVPCNWGTPTPTPTP